MHKEFLLLMSLLFCFFYKSTAQQFDSTLEVYSEQLAAEKIHIHTDRSVYKTDETIYYKAYVLTGNELSALSKILYLDWYDEAGTLMKQTAAPLLLSSAKGSFSIPDSYAGSAVYLKAYTKWMLNFDTRLLYTRKITIWQPGKGTRPKNDTGIFDSIVVQLFPEGGFSILGVMNRFAFKARTRSGHPVSVKGIIKNGEDQILDSFATIHDGMGAFFLMPEPGKKYFFNWVDALGRTGITAIEVQKPSGAILRVSPGSNQVKFTVERSPNTGADFKMVHLLVHQNLNLRYKLDLDLSIRRMLSSAISLTDLPTGMVQFTLFNAEWLPVGERTIFVNNQNHLFYPRLSVISKSLSKRGKNEIQIEVKDSILTNMSVAITEASIAGLNEPSIFSDFFISDNITDRLKNIEYYFAKDTISDADTIQTEKPDSLLAATLDLVMLTHGHRRFDWEKLAKGITPKILFPADTGYLKIKGQVTEKRLLASKSPLFLNIILEGKNSNKSMLALAVKDGSFEEPCFYTDSAKIFYSLSNGKPVNKPGLIQFKNSIMTDEDRKNFFSSLGIATLTSSHNKETNVDTFCVQQDTFFAEQGSVKKNRSSQTLKEVVVKTKAKTRAKILDDFYTSGFYGGGDNNYPIDVEGDIFSQNYPDIFSYLQTRVPGLRVENSGSAEPVPVWFPDAHGIPSVPALLLDEVPVSLSAVNTVSIASIAYVKAFRPPFLGTMLNGFSGVIALYSKRGTSPLPEANSNGLGMTLLQGYTQFGEYTDRLDQQNVSEPDHRSTVYWNPFLLTDKNNQRATIQFYNNDVSKKLYLILEGFNEEGKMTRLVKLLR